MYHKQSFVHAQEDTREHTLQGVSKSPDGLCVIDKYTYLHMFVLNSLEGKNKCSWYYCFRCCKFLHSDRDCWWHRYALDYNHYKLYSAHSQVDKTVDNLLKNWIELAVKLDCGYHTWTVLSGKTVSTCAHVVNIIAGTNNTGSSVLTRVTSDADMYRVAPTAVRVDPISHWTTDDAD